MLYLLRSSWFRRIYIEIFSQANFQSHNRQVLKLALQGAGLNTRGLAEENGEAFLIQKLREMGLKSAIDVGANVGSYSKVLLELGFENVVAFEPNPLCLTELRTLQDLYPGQLHVVNAGVGREKGTLPLHFTADNTVFGSFAEEVNQVPYVSNTETVVAEMTTLDTYVDSHSLRVDFLKIDTEGFEDEVLAGAQNVIRSMRPRAIQMEFNHHHLFRGTSLFGIWAEFLKDYAVYRLLPLGHGVVRLEASDPYANFFLFSNYIFVAGEHVREFESLLPVAYLN